MAAREIKLGSLFDGSGDFRGVNIHGMHRVSIGPDSIIGDGAELAKICIWTKWAESKRTEAMEQ